ncbi:MAG: aspartate kinase [Saprospiraceae bacterium]|nr:aspartate kinase [Saprospiraceae bacterium]
MKVLKFGGTSVGSPDRMREVAEIITRDEDQKIVVLSAISGTTNALENYARDLLKGDKDEAQAGLKKLQEDYREFLDTLYKEQEILEKAQQYIDERFDFLSALSNQVVTETEEKLVLAQGELMSTHLFSWLLEEDGISAKLLPALNYMRIDKMYEPDDYYIASMVQKELALTGDYPIYITQGYICRDAFGKVDNLKRGGSDYTATLLGQAVKAEEIQIWTDIDGMHNNDPRVVDNTYPIKKLSYGEAAELAYFGAKILHPSCVLPAQKGGVPIMLKNTMDPDARGTIISSNDSNTDITAVAAKDGITAIKIKSGRMLMAYGFLKKVFEVFEHYETPIDMITTSEVAVSLTIDDCSHLDNILHDLREFGEVEVDEDQTIICIVGHFGSDQSGYATRIFSSLANIPVRMISYGGSRFNVSILVKSPYKKEALQLLNQGLFDL